MNLHDSYHESNEHGCEWQNKPSEIFINPVFIEDLYNARLQRESEESGKKVES